MPAKTVYDRVNRVIAKAGKNGLVIRRIRLSRADYDELIGELTCAGTRFEKDEHSDWTNVWFGGGLTVVHPDAVRDGSIWFSGVYDDQAGGCC